MSAAFARLSDNILIIDAFRMAPSKVRRFLSVHCWEPWLWYVYSLALVHALPALAADRRSYCLFYWRPIIGGVRPFSTIAATDVSAFSCKFGKMYKI